MRDYRCGINTYDAHGGVDFAIHDAIATREGVTVVAAAAGKVKRLRDGALDGRGGEAADPDQACGNGVVVCMPGRSAGRTRVEAAWEAVADSREAELESGATKPLSARNRWNYCVGRYARSKAPRLWWFASIGYRGHSPRNEIRGANDTTRFL